MEQPHILETMRLVLRPFELSDASEVQRLAGDRAIADTTLNIPHPYEDGLAERWITTQRPKVDSGELCNFAIVLERSEEMIGGIGLTVVPRFQRAELGYWIGKPYWNNGYCFEAAQSVIDYGFGTLNLNRIHASHFSRNLASERVLQKLGMVREGLSRQHVKRWDGFEDLEMYGILKVEWEKNTEQESAPNP